MFVSSNMTLTADVGPTPDRRDAALQENPEIDPRYSRIFNNIGLKTSVRLTSCAYRILA